MINEIIKKLVTYGIEKNITNKLDKIFVTNKIIEILNLKEYSEPETEYKDITLKETLEELYDYAIQSGIIKDDEQEKNELSSQVMGCLLPLPHEVTDSFKKIFRTSPKRATSWLYSLAKDSDYIKTYEISKNVKWSPSTKYGRVDILIDSQKKEQTNPKTNSYPKCGMCHENEGYKFNSNLRMLPITVDKEDWMFWYAPEGHFNEQCIASNPKHSAVPINDSTFTKLFEFINIFPHYFVGIEPEIGFGNQPAPEHEKFMGGYCETPIEKASVEKYYSVKRFEDVQLGILKWPATAIRIRYKDYTKLVKLANHIYQKWKIYNDEALNIVDKTNGEEHNSACFIARKIGDLYELDIILRNNRKTSLYPQGIFNPSEKYHHIKSDGLTLSDFMGMAVLPARLNPELKAVADKILECENLYEDELTAKHAKWVEKFILEYDDISGDNIDKIIQTEVGRTFIEMLESSAVFKHNPEGQEGLEKFIQSL